jgi:hypothetical protein
MIPNNKVNDMRVLLCIIFALLVLQISTAVTVASNLVDNDALYTSPPIKINTAHQVIDTSNGGSGGQSGPLTDAQNCAACKSIVSKLVPLLLTDRSLILMRETAILVCETFVHPDCDSPGIFCVKRENRRVYFMVHTCHTCPTIHCMIQSGVQASL